MINPINVAHDPRMAGLVKRYHVHPVREQTVAEHSWQICRILLAMCPEDIANILLPHAIMHDVGEVAVGDVPFPVKKDNELLDRLFSEIEATAVSQLQRDWGIPPAVIQEWDPSLRWVFKTAEYIEMMEFGMEELIRGNEFGRIIYDRMKALVESRLEEFAYTEDWEREMLHRTRAYVDRREKEWGRYV